MDIGRMIAALGLAAGCSVFAGVDPDNNVIEDVHELESCYEARLAQIPPTPSTGVFLDVSEKAIPADWKKFPVEMRKELYAEMDENGFPIYYVTVFQDVATRETVFLNCHGSEIHRLAPPSDYNATLYVFLLRGINILGMDEFNRWIFDPAHIAVELALIPEIFYADYQAVQEEQTTMDSLMLVRTLSASESITDFRVIQDGTNLSVNLPEEFAGATISLESKTNLLDSGWASVFQTNAPASGTLSLCAADLPDVPCEMIITTNSETIYIDPIDGTTNVIPAGVYTNYECSTVAAFYRTSAESPVDSDSDGLDNVSEYGEGTDYQNAESDGGDGLPDGYEVLVSGTDPNAMDATQAQIDAYQAVAGDVDTDGRPQWLEEVNGTNPHDRFD